MKDTHDAVLDTSKLFVVVVCSTCEHSTYDHWFTQICKSQDEIWKMEEWTHDLVQVVNASHWRALMSHHVCVFIEDVAITNVY